MSSVGLILIRRPRDRKQNRSIKRRAMADHMAGINALPRWDPNNLDKGCRYDWRDYNPQDYQRFKEARRERNKSAKGRRKPILRRQ
jgi:hypothetical protein